MGGGGSNRAQQQAEAEERARQARIQQTTAQVNSIFDSPERQAQYGKYGDALREYYAQDVNRQKTVADRDLKFAMARSGNTGGSVAVDSGRRLGQEYTKGLLSAERQAQGQVANLMNQDEQARSNLIGLAQAGLGATQAAQQAAGALRANLMGAESAGKMQSLGDLFSGIGEIKRASEARDIRREQDNLYGMNYYQSMFEPRG